MAAPKPGPTALPREHGTVRGYRQHTRHGETPCQPCLEAGRAHPRQQAADRRAEQAARRERWRLQDASSN
jgi:hypothetical protein